jgi:riboflavin kinase / FMN adenylyltransferase
MGVYAIRTEWEGKWMNGVANIGRRPTIGGSYPQLEIHVFDFDGDLYGQELVVNLMDFIRPERKFPGLKELKQQITEDGIKARSLLKTHNLAE